jgi:pimeloyl-ACP methyl ester carboxylesterase
VGIGRGRAVAVAAWSGVLALLGPAAVAPLAPVGSAAATPAAASTGLGPVEHVAANGLSIGYRTGGQGRWLVLVMGRSGTMADWTPVLIRQLTRDNRVLVFDNRGMGTTGDGAVPASGVTVPLMARDTLALAGALGIGRFDLMGWSMGGEIAQQVAVDAPHRVRRLVLCATGAGGPTEVLPSASVEALLSEPNLPTATLFTLSFPQTPAGKRASRAYVARVVAQSQADHLPPDSFSTTPTGLAGQQNARTQWTSAAGGVYHRLAGLTMQVLVMWGNRDVIVPPANDRLLVEQLRHVRHEVFPGAGHAFLFQYPQPVGKAVDAFLG